MSSPRFKYPRTPHLPWSPGIADDDIRAATTAVFAGKEVIVTEKMDGENTTMYPDYIHARSIDGRHHPSRDRVKGLHASIGYMIPQGWRLCGENLYARHSIPYERLRGYFYLFAIWEEQNVSLGWGDVEEWSARLGLPTPPVLYRGLWDEARIRAIDVDPAISEGYVVRNAGSFRFDAFAENIAKWVRKGHVQTDEHWMTSAIVPNVLASDEELTKE